MFCWCTALMCNDDKEVVEVRADKAEMEDWWKEDVVGGVLVRGVGVKEEISAASGEENQKIQASEVMISSHGDRHISFWLRWAGEQSLFKVHPNI